MEEKIRNNYLRCKSAIEVCYKLLRSPQDNVGGEIFAASFGRRNMMSAYILPLSLVAALATFAGSATLRHFSVEAGVAKSVFCLISLYCTALIATPAFHALLNRRYYAGISRRGAEMITATLMSASFAVAVLGGLMPNMFFIQFGLVMVPYLAGIAIDRFACIDERFRTRFMVISSAMIIALPHAITKIIGILLPNLAR